MKKRFLRFPDVQKLVGLSRTTIWRLEQEGKFPARKKLGENSVAWLEEEIEKWILSKNSKKKKRSF